IAIMANGNMLFANFNQDFSCVSVGTRKGYSITNCDPFGRVFTMNDGARGIVEMLFCTSLIALVGAADQPQSSPRKLQIVNTKRQSMICELLFPSSILAVKLNRKTLVIVLEVEIYIYDISNMRLLHVIETTKNPDAICALSPSADNSYLAYPSPVPSPTPPLNSTGTLLATSSDKGTVIRVWSVPGAEKLYQFRRGTRETRIYSMSFNVVGTLLAVSSAHDTVHIFKLGGQRAAGQSVDSRDSSQGPDTGSTLRRKSLQMTKSITHSMGGYLPNTLTELWEPSRDFAFLRLPTSGARCIVALSGTTPHVMVISSDGYFYSYSIDLEHGGECQLVKQYRCVTRVLPPPSFVHSPV
ncbi:Autophagy-related protein 18, partial [Termitomyces sp. J132]